MAVRFYNLILAAHDTGADIWAKLIPLIVVAVFALLGKLGKKAGEKKTPPSQQQRPVPREVPAETRLEIPTPRPPRQMPGTPTDEAINARARYDEVVAKARKRFELTIEQIDKYDEQMRTKPMTDAMRQHTYERIREAKKAAQVEFEQTRKAAQQKLRDTFEQTRAQRQARQEKRAHVSQVPRRETPSSQAPAPVQTPYATASTPPQATATVEAKAAAKPALATAQSTASAAQVHEESHQGFELEHADLMRAVIYSEILGKPLALRQGGYAGI
jgi:hypothetical protein